MSETKEKRKIKIDTTPKTKEAYEVLIIDRSSSMAYQRDTTINGINTYVKNLKEESEKYGIKTQLMMIMFDSEVEVMYSFTDIKEFVELTPSNYVPGGMTALNDAVMLGIESVKAAVKGREKDEDVDVTINIFTDGYENVSKKYPNNSSGENVEIKGLIKELCDEYKWTITYTGAGTQEQAQSIAQSLSIPVGNALSYSAGAAGPAGPQGALGATSVRARSMKMASFAKGESYDQTSYFASAGATPQVEPNNLQARLARSMRAPRQTVVTDSLVGDVVSDPGLIATTLDVVSNVCASVVDTVSDVASSAVDTVSDVASAACDCASSCCD